MEFIYLFLLSLYILSCLWVIKKYYKLKYGVFQAPFIFSLASMLMMTPQFTTIIYNKIYDPDILWDLTFVMITGTIAFAKGFEKAAVKSIDECYDIDMDASRITFLLLFVVGVFCTYTADSVATAFRLDEGGDIRDNHEYQFFLFFRRYFDVGFFYALTYVVTKDASPKVIKIIIAIGALYYFYIVAYFARRALAVKVFMSLALLFSKVKSNWESFFKYSVIIFFSIGIVYNASIGAIRGNLGNVDDNIEINYWENFKASFNEQYLPHGMDLANGGLFIKYTKDHMNYNLGLFLWDDIVTWYMPSFIFGKEGKESMKLANANNKYIDSICHGVSTSTGYYDAFAAFWYFGFILFYALGYILGGIWNRAQSSSLYLILYLSLMFNIPNLASHGFSYIIGNIETFIVFVLPFIWRFIYKKKLYY